MHIHLPMGFCDYRRPFTVDRRPETANRPSETAAGHPASQRVSSTGGLLEELSGGHFDAQTAVTHPHVPALHRV